jgi:nucleoside diphosphate kinase
MLKPDTVHRNLVSDVIKMLTQKGVIILEQKQVTVD